MDTVSVSMASESVNTTNSQPYVEFSDFKRTGQILILGKTIQTRELVMGVLLLVAVIVIIALIPLASGVHITKVAPNTCNTEQCVEVAGTILSRMNQTVDPCDDFHQYSCGRWAMLHPLTPEQSTRTVRGEMYLNNRESLRVVLESDVKNDTEMSTERKLKDFFRSCLDEVNRNSKGGKAFLEQVVNKTGGWIGINTYNENTWDLNENFRKVHVDFWTDVLVKLNVGTDWNDNTKNIIEIDLGGLGLPWQTYTREDAQAANTREAYKAYMRRAGELLMIDAGMIPSTDLGKQRLDAFVRDVYEIEFGLANMTLYTLPTNNPHDDDAKLTLTELNEQAGGTVIDWKALIMYAFEGAGVTAETKVVLLERDYIFKLSQYLKDLQVNHYLDDTKRYMNHYFLWRMLETYMPGLSAPYSKAQQDFRHQWLGTEGHTVVWETCFTWVSTHLKEGLGAVYVQNGFPKSIKDMVHDMATEIKTQTTNRVDAVDWMDDATKASAKAKLAASVDKLAYPDKFDDHAYIDKIHDTLTIDRNDFFANLLSVTRFTRQELNRQLVSRENRDVWRVNTWDVYAEFYNPWNELLVPAGFMHYPMFWTLAPGFFNWGGLGQVLSKTYIYAIDETGGFYAPDGSVNDWWSQETTGNFLNNRQCLIDYYNTKEAGPYRTKTSVREGEKIKIKGSFYGRGAVSDIGGVRSAFKAWESSKARTEQLRLPSPDLNPDQLFFVSYAQASCFNRRDDIAYELVRDGFVPENIAVNTALEQVEDFARVFNCPAGSKMNPAERCSVY